MIPTKKHILIMLIFEPKNFSREGFLIGFELTLQEHFSFGQMFQTKVMKSRTA